MGDLIANLKAVQDAAIAAAASQPGIDISQVLLQIQAAMNKVQDNSVQTAPTEPPSPLGNVDDEDLDDTFVLELVNGYR